MTKHKCFTEFGIARDVGMDFTANTFENTREIRSALRAVKVS
jgi:hypothetical protein